MADRGPKHERHGLVTTEAALLMPLLLLLVFGVVEYGWMFLKLSEITDAARRGARAAVVPDVLSDGQVTDPAYTPTPPAIALLNEAGIPVTTDTVTVPTGVSPGTGNLVRVVVTVPYSDVGLLHLPFIPTPATLTASVSMAKEGLDE